MVVDFASNEITQQQTDSNFTKTDEVIAKYNADKELLTSMLHDIQMEYNYLPQDILIHISKKLNLPLIQVYGVATFFKAFSLVPKGKHLINICLGTACHVRGTKEVLQRVEQELGIESGETTEDMQFTLETVNCLGACALGPVMVIDGKYNGHMTPIRVIKLLEEFSADNGSVNE